MPERIIREGILESDAVNRLSPEAELFYRRIMSVVDDYGRFEWDVKKIRLRVFGYRFDWATEAKIKAWMRECEAELIVVYRVGAKEYFELQKFNQRLRAQKSKFPGPVESTRSRENVSQVQGRCHADDGHLRTEAETEAESETESEATEESTSSQQGRAPASPPPQKIKFPFRDPKPASQGPPGAIRSEAPRGNHAPKPSKGPLIRVETNQAGPNGMHKPARIELPPALSLAEQNLARWLAEVTDQRMFPKVPDPDVVRPLLRLADELGITREDLQGEIAEVIRRQRKSSSRWVPNSWGWFREIVPKVIQQGRESRAG